MLHFTEAASAPLLRDDASGEWGEKVSLGPLLLELPDFVRQAACEFGSPGRRRHP